VIHAASAQRVVTCDGVPLVPRQAILAAEDTSFFTHSGSAVTRVDVVP
jgi:membrane carboxypeptidase/penicillin-binding protein